MLEYSNKKYNIMVILLILVISVVFSFSVYFNTLATKGQIAVDEDINVPVIVPDTDNIEIEQTNQPPVFKNGIEAALYSIEKLKSGIDFEGTYNNRTNGAGLAVVDVYMERFRHRNHDILHAWSTQTLDIVAEGKFFKVSYSNSETNKTRQTTNYSFKDKTYNFTNEAITGDEITKFIYLDKVSNYNNFHIPFDSSMVREVYFNKSDKTTYEVKLVFIQSKLSDSKYVKTLIRGGADKVDMNKLNLTLTIDKQTGLLLKAVSEEVYKIYKGPFFAECSGSSISTYTYPKSTKEKVIKFAQDELGLYLDMKV